MVCVGDTDILARDTDTYFILYYYYPQFTGHLVKISSYPLIPERKQGVNR